MGEESDAVQDWSEDDEGFAQDMRDLTVGKMQARYDDAKRAHVGATVRCPTCSVLHVKTTYHKVFCSNGKTRGKGNCKDGFWNYVPDERASRAHHYGR